MDKLMIVSATIFTIWFILFEQHIVIKTAAFAVDDSEEFGYTTENATIENSTDIYDEFQDTLAIDMEIPDHANDKEIKNRSDTSDDIIKLNVGGTILATYRSTLTAIPNSKLALMFTKKTKNIDKSYFFDYNPVQFEHLLDRLRFIKRLPPVPAYELNLADPPEDKNFAFSLMVYDLGLNPERFLLPLEGTHTNLTVNSLIGWKLCYRGKYDEPFDIGVLSKTCKGHRLLVACRIVADRNTLIVAGIGQREKLFHPCSPNSHCSITAGNETGFYYAENHAWGFQGRPSEWSAPTNIPYNPHYYGARPSGSFYLNPCDSSDEYSAYRLCWSLRSSVGRGGGDRCGSSKNLHNTKGWERVIYQTA